MYMQTTPERMQQRQQALRIVAT